MGTSLQVAKDFWESKYPGTPPLEHPVTEEGYRNTLKFLELAEFHPETIQRFKKGTIRSLKRFTEHQELLGKLSDFCQ